MSRKEIFAHFAVVLPSAVVSNRTDSTPVA
jgi:hypothetical protein